ncbi:hypothetical protein PFISCL1PPCAC_24940, partial [Pristionchus fissidentatus]
MKLLVHSSILAGFLFTWYLDYYYMPPEVLLIKNQPLSKLGWLTMVGVTLQTVYHFVGVFFALFGNQNSSRHFHFIGQALLGPLGVGVAILFWGLWMFDEQTLAKDAITTKLMQNPVWNHGLHTLPAISSFLDVIIYRRPNLAFSRAFKPILAFTLFYIADVYLIHYLSGNWAYPILGDLGSVGRIAFY